MLGDGHANLRRGMRYARPDGDVGRRDRDAQLSGADAAPEQRERHDVDTRAAGGSTARW
jgi:hypothetical protein